MKTILYFIGLKIAEIIGLVAIYYSLCFLATVTRMVNDDIPLWTGGAAIIMGVFTFTILIILILQGFWALMKKNWKLAKRLSKGYLP